MIFIHSPVKQPLKMCLSSGIESDGWKTFGTGCYRFFGMRKTWSEADKYCVQEGGHLSSFHSHPELAPAHGRTQCFTTSIDVSCVPVLKLIVVSVFVVVFVVFLSQRPERWLREHVGGNENPVVQIWKWRGPLELGPC
uniref:C-type lectin domain-containing protein n=1 Tax=Hippocampus comes TaxID=109280 RepID=A0A3Q2XEA8_HIPCM